MQLLERVPFLAALSEDDRRWLHERARRRTFTRGDIIFQKDDPGQSLFIIEQGSVRIYVPGAQGVDLTLAVMGEGDFFGDISPSTDGLARPAPRRSARPHSSASSAPTYEPPPRPPRGLAPDPRQIAKRIRDTDQMATDLAFLDVSGRLARKLSELAGSHGAPRDGGILIDIPLTQEELANMIGVTRESVNRNLGEFRRLGFVTREGRRLLIRNPDGLRDYWQ